LRANHAARVRDLTGPQGSGQWWVPASGRVCEITNGRFVNAKQEKRWLAVRLLWSNPAVGFGS
jgi:hypothetical protein